MNKFKRRSFKNRKPKRYGRKIIGFLFLIAIVWTGFNFLLSTSIASLALSHQFEDAESKLKKWGWLTMQPEPIQASLFFLSDLKNNTDELGKIINTETSLYALSSDDVITLYFNVGRMEIAQKWMKITGNNSPVLLDDFFSMARFDFSDKPANVTPFIESIYDNKALPLMMANKEVWAWVKENDEIEMNQLLHPKVFWKSVLSDDISTVRNGKFRQWTLTKNIQGKIRNSLGTEKALVCIMDIKTGDILGLYGHDSIDPMEPFPPASVWKTLTYAAYRERYPNTKLFPYNSKSSMKISGKPFYEWKPGGHGKLKSLNEAMAVSCNLFFAELGIEIGWDEWKMSVSKWFPENMTIGWPSQQPTNLVWQEKSTSNINNCWSYLGIKQQKIGVMELTHIADTIVNDGVARQHLVSNGFINWEEKNIKMDFYLNSPKKVVGTAIAHDLKNSWKHAISNKKGTLNGLHKMKIKAAGKTGTSGNRPFSATVSGYFPTEKPLYSIGIWVPKGGKADIAGTRVYKAILKEFSKSG